MSRKVVILISGYPGSGKTTFADALASSLAESCPWPVRKVKAVRKRWLSRPLPVAWSCIRHLWLLLSLVFLLQSVKGAFNILVLPKTFRDAVRLVFNYSSLCGLRHAPENEVMIIDEPPWHQLWIKMYPPVMEPPKKLLSHIIKIMTKPAESEFVFLLVDIKVPVEVCIDRFKARNYQGTRFNIDTPVLNIESFKNDHIYPLIQDELRSNVSDNVILVQDSYEVNRDGVLEMIHKYAK